MPDHSGDEIVEIIEKSISINGDAGEFIDLSYDLSTILFEMFTGYMSEMDIAEAGDTCAISMAIESKMIVLRQSSNLRYTDEDQKKAFSGDLAFEFVNRIQNESLTWGS